MKQYVLDELRLEDYNIIKSYFDKKYHGSGMDSLYWIELEYSMLSAIQKQHKECGPFYFAIDLEENKLSCELLIRSTNKVHCNCIGYANIKQRNWIIQVIDNIIKLLEIIT